MTEETAQDAAQPGRPWWRAILPTAVAGSVTALALTLSLVASSQAGASNETIPIDPVAARVSSPVDAVGPAPRTPPPWQVVAHRGGLVWGPESTRATFDHVLETGAEGVEFDVRFTRDQVPVVFHDVGLSRTTDCTGPLATYTLKQLRRCDSGSWFTPSFPGLHVLTLEEVLTQLGAGSTSLRFYLHMKRFAPAQAKAVVAAVRRHGLDDGRATLLCNDALCLERFTRAGAHRVGFMFTDKAGWDSDAPVLVPYDFTPSPAAIRAAHERGQLVFSVEGHPGSVRELIRLGLDGVFANDLDAALAERPE